jgi:NAD(P)H-dependent flavin oxidoreductase YrpB (nitropropane dioxygenase family)
MMANALGGVPPPYMIEAGTSSGVPVAALVGAKEHAVKRIQAGVDVIIAQGTEAGGHCDEVSLTTEEAETAPYTVQKMPAASSRDTVRSTGRTGKPARQLASDWTDAWLPDKQKSLPLPLQNMLVEPVLRRVDQLAAQGHPGAQALATYFVGQGVGLMNKVKPAREVVLDFIEDYVIAAERLAASLED